MQKVNRWRLLFEIHEVFRCQNHSGHTSEDTIPWCLRNVEKKCLVLILFCHFYVKMSTDYFFFHVSHIHLNYSLEIQNLLGSSYLLYQSFSQKF